MIFYAFSKIISVCILRSTYRNCFNIERFFICVLAEHNCKISNTGSITNKLESKTILFFCCCVFMKKIFSLQMFFSHMDVENYDQILKCLRSVSSLSMYNFAALFRYTNML